MNAVNWQEKKGAADWQCCFARHPNPAQNSIANPEGRA
jgi:hypothetical protein